jgi:hypothetical protein
MDVVVTINKINIMTNTERFFRFLGCYVSRSGILHTKTWFAKIMADRGVIDGNFIYLGRNMYKVNKEE